MGRSKATAQISAHVSPAVAAEVRALAAARGLTVSATLGSLVTEALRFNVEHQHGSLIEVTVERAIDRQLGRIGELAFRGALRADETRRLLRPILERAVGEEAAKALRREIHSAAWQATSDPLPAPNGSQAAWANGSRPS